jgi:hypothetical protein
VLHMFLALTVNQPTESDLMHILVNQITMTKLILYWLYLSHGLRTQHSYTNCIIMYHMGIVLYLECSRIPTSNSFFSSCYKFIVAFVCCTLSQS